MHGPGRKAPPGAGSNVVEAGVVHRGERGGGHGRTVGVLHRQRPPLGRAGAELVAEGSVVDQ